MESFYDFIIVGSGPCGLLSASYLSSIGKCLIIEQGIKIKQDSENDTYTFNQIHNAYQGSGFNFALGFPPVILSEGRNIGGGSSVNSSLHHRAPNNIWKMWREKFLLKGFNIDKVNEGYLKIEKIFKTNIGSVEPSTFYKTASRIGEKVERIPRWGIENDKGILIRSSASKIFIEKIKSNNGAIIGNLKFLNAYRDRNDNWVVLVKNLLTKKKYNLYCNNLVLAMGAGYTPSALHNLGLKHKQLGKFEIHPTARISIYYPEEKRPKSIVEPFQITGYFPNLMIGSSANRETLSEANYPFKENLHNIDFSKVQNFYSMTPSNRKGKIILKGALRNTKFYFLDLKTKLLIKKGLKKIINIAYKSNCRFIYHSGELIDKDFFQKNDNVNSFIESCIKKTLSSVHIMASCSIGENVNLCPLNSFGKIDGINNLLVIDQSTLPSCPTINPQSTAALISYINTQNFINNL
tara:strand:+ start:2741 stop:4132 length:1392 start_codon:yes stop_codon:yes gene_type:complete